MLLLSSSLNSFLQLVGVLLIFICVLVATYFATRWIGGVQKSQMKGHSLQVIDTVQIAGNKYIQLIRAGEAYLVIAVGKEEVRLLAQLTGEQLGIDASMPECGKPAGSATARGKETFQEVLDRFREHFPKKQD